MHMPLLSVFACLCECKAVLACQATPFPLLVISLGVQALEREAKHLSLLIEDASRLLWCPAGTTAADRCQREGTEEDI